MAKRNDNGGGGDGGPHRSAEPTQAVAAEVQIGGQRSQGNLGRSMKKDCERAPDNENRHHESGDLHNTKRFAAGFVYSLNVASPEVSGDNQTEPGGKQVGRHAQWRVGEFSELIQQM